MKQYFIHDSPEDRKAVTEWCNALFGPKLIPSDLILRWNWFPLYFKKNNLSFRVDIHQPDDQLVFELTWGHLIVETE